MNNVITQPLAFIVAFLLATAIGIFFCESPLCFEKDNDTDLVVQRSSSVFQFRGEYWMQTRFGNHGLEEHDAAKLASSLPKVLFFGDSYVEVYMIPANERMQNHLNCVGGDKKHEGIGIGCSGSAAPEFYAYETL